jgi:uncharacterized protein (DUF1499 family)
MSIIAGIGPWIVGCIGLVALLLYFKNKRTPALGVDGGLLTPLSSKPNGVSTQANDHKRVEPLPLKSTAEKTLHALKAAAQAYGGATTLKETDNYLRIVFATPTMKYRDDAEFYIDNAAGVVHFRSASRLGYSDMGLNKARYKKLAELYASQAD